MAARLSRSCVRRDEDLRGLARYIVANPLRAQLVQRIGDYPHWDAMWLDEGEGFAPKGAPTTTRGLL